MHQPFYSEKKKSINVGVMRIGGRGGNLGVGRVAKKDHSLFLSVFIRRLPQSS
jgi:hypothetical protein